MYWFIGLAAMLLTAFPASGQTKSSRCSKNLVYANYNQIDPEAVETSTISGRALSDSGEPVRDLCIALFSVDGKKRIAVVSTDKDGKFRFPKVAEGAYRLVSRIEYDFLCPVSARIIIRKQVPAKPLQLNMRVGGIDECSDLETVRDN